MVTIDLRAIIIVIIADLLITDMCMDGDIAAIGKKWLDRFFLREYFVPKRCCII